VSRADRVELRTLAIALLASLLLWNLPFGGVLLYPFKLLATWFHELSHALMMVLTGTGVKRVVFFRDTSGMAYSSELQGPFVRPIIAAAGYMGTSLWGALLLVVTPTGRAARIALLVLAGLLCATALLVIEPAEGDPFGPLATAGIGAASAAVAIVVPPRWRVAVAHFVAAQLCVNALLDIRVLLRPMQLVNGAPVMASDAHSMASATFGTHDRWAVWFWAITWLVWSLIVLFVALRVSGRRALAEVVPYTRPPRAE
jgi:Peptidase M50B-like